MFKCKITNCKEIFPNVVKMIHHLHYEHKLHDNFNLYYEDLNNEKKYKI